MKTLITSLPVAALVATMLLPHAALARGQSAFLGIPPSPSEAPCWSHSVGAVTNNCSQTRQWCMPAVVDRMGSFNVRVYAFGATPSSNVGCHAAGADLNGNATSVSPTVYLPGFGATQALELGNVWVPEFGTLYVCCDVNQGGRIINYHYW